MDKDTKVIEGGHQRPSFLLGLPSIGTVSTKFCVAFGRLQMPCNARTQTMVVERMEVGIARNLIAEDFNNMDPKPRYLFFLGDDMLPPWDGLLRLWDEMESGGWDVLGGMYFLKQEPPEPLMRREGLGSFMIPGEHFNIGDVVPVDITGLDFTLIRADVFDKIKKPYFKTGYTYTSTNDHCEIGHVIKHTEDVWFYNQLREQGMRIGVHTGVRVGHYDDISGKIF